METKICTECGLEKPLTEFVKNCCKNQVIILTAKNVIEKDVINIIKITKTNIRIEIEQHLLRLKIT